VEGAAVLVAAGPFRLPQKLRRTSALCFYVENQLFMSKNIPPLADIASPSVTRGRFSERQGALATAQAFPLTKIALQIKKTGVPFQKQGDPPGGQAGRHTVAALLRPAFAKASAGGAGRKYLIINKKPTVWLKITSPKTKEN
jgi:hypothetical protein